MYKMEPTVHEILPGLWLGGIESSCDQDFINKNKIHSIVNCTTHINNSFEDIYYLRIPLFDIPSESEKLKKYFIISKDFILNSLRTRGKGVLIHCHAGISRSVSILISFLLQIIPSLDYDSAYKIIKKRRNFVRPNEGFEKAIKETFSK